jgi:uncharacterized membrane protein YhaH (DUF805 family)
VNCPQCGLISPKAALRCDCGYNFSSGELKESYERKKQQVIRMPVSDILFSFQGRIDRKTFWVPTVCMLPFSSLTVFWGREGLLPVPVMLILLSFFVWVGLAVSIKRWHDRGKSGWWVLIGLIPLIGGIWTFVELGFLEGTKGLNAYDFLSVPHRVTHDRSTARQTGPIIFRCWVCKAEITIQPEMRGRRTKCTACGTGQACPT